VITYESGHQGVRKELLYLSDHITPIRKGSATEATSSPETSLPSVFHRGEWSLGVVLDIYWKFAQKGDQLLGRILAGLDPDHSTFDVLPPHFTKTDDPKIKEAMNLCFGNIIIMLLWCLSSLVHHESSVHRIINTVPQHPWKCLLIFCDEELLQYLKSIVTTKPTPGNWHSMTYKNYEGSG